MQKKKRGKNLPKSPIPVDGISLPNRSKYLVTLIGVYSLLENRFLKGCLGCRGYMQCWLLCDDGKRRWFAIHRLIAEAYVPNPHNRPVAHHRDHNKLNNTASNLEWVSNRQNIRYAIEAGCWNKGMKGKHMSGRKLSEQIKQKMSYAKEGSLNYKYQGLYSYLGVVAPTQKALAEALGLSTSAVNRLWKEGFIDLVPEATPSIALVYREEARTYAI